MLLNIYQCFVTGYSVTFSCCPNSTWRL